MTATRRRCEAVTLTSLTAAHLPPGCAVIAARPISPASSVTAAATCVPGSWAISITGGAGTWSGSRLSCTGCTGVLLGRWLACSLLPAVAVPGGKSRNQRAGSQQILQPAHGRRGRRLAGLSISAAALGCRVGPCRRNQRLAAIGQHQQQLQ